MDRMVARYAFMLVCVVIFSAHSCDPVSPDALWIAYSAAILYGTAFGWTFICLNTITGIFMDQQHSQG